MLRKYRSLAAAFLTGAAGLISLFPAPLAAQSDEAVFQFRNESSYAIREIHVSPTYSGYWRDDLLGMRVLPSGYVYTSPAFETGRYDVKLVDQDNDVCIVKNVGLYRASVWTITDSWLLDCERNSQ